MIIRIWDNCRDQIIVSYPNLRDIPHTPELEQQLCDHVWADAVSSHLVIEGERDYYRFELKSHPSKQKINS